MPGYTEEVTSEADVPTVADLELADELLVLRPGADPVSARNPEGYGFVRAPYGAMKTDLDAASGLAAADAAAADAARVLAEAARDASFTNANVYADIATGRAAVADGAQFVVVAGNESIRYRRDSSSTQTEMARYFTSAGVRQEAYTRATFAARESANLFKISETIDGGFTSPNTGAWNVNALYAQTGMMPVVAGRTYRANMTIAYSTFYTIDGTLIPTPAVGVANNPIVAPAGAAFMTLSTTRAAFYSQTAPLMVTEGASVPGAFIPYDSPAGPITLSSKIEARIAARLPVNQNLFNAADTVLNTVPVSGTGEVVFGSGWSASPLIPVVPGVSYFTNKTLYNVVYFDEAGRWVSGEQGPAWAANTARTMPAAVCYTRYAVLNADVAAMTFTKGSAAPASVVPYAGVAASPLFGVRLGFRGDSIFYSNGVQTRMATLAGTSLTFNSNAPGTFAGWSTSGLSPANLATVDVLVFGHMLNDWFNGRVLGTPADAPAPVDGAGDIINFNAQTFCASVKAEIKRAREANPLMKIIRVIPHKSFNVSPVNKPTWNTNNPIGLKQKAYVDALKTICEEASIPVLDRYSICNFDEYNQASYMYDGVHAGDGTGGNPDQMDAFYNPFARQLSATIQATR